MTSRAALATFRYALIALTVGVLLVPGSARAAPVQLFLNRAYEVGASERRELESFLSTELSDPSGDPLQFNPEWLNYDRALDVADARGPLIAIITTGMYAKIVTTRGGSKGLQLVATVKKRETTTYRWRVLVKRGVSLSNPKRFVGHMAIKKSASLSGSIFPIDYLARRHGFPRALLFDEALRAEWAQIEGYHGDLLALKARDDGRWLYAGEALEQDRKAMTDNGWDVYPVSGEPEAGFQITRSLVLVRGLDPKVVDRLQHLLYEDDARATFNRLMKIEGFAPADQGAVQQVIDRYASVLAAAAPANKREGARSRDGQPRDVQSKSADRYLREFALAILFDAIERVPQVKWALGVAGLGAAAFILSIFFGLNFKKAFLAVGLMLIAMTLLVVFSTLSTELDVLRPLAIAMAYAFGALAVALPVLTLSSVFFRRPLDLSHWLAKSPGDPRVG